MTNYDQNNNNKNSSKWPLVNSVLRTAFFMVVFSSLLLGLSACKTTGEYTDAQKQMDVAAYYVGMNYLISSKFPIETE